MLVVHRAERADALAAGLADLLREPLDDPFAPEVVAVPARGVERWVTQRLSHVLGAGSAGDGVCARVELPSPERLVDDVLAAVSGVDPRDDPWRPARLAWTVLTVLDDALDLPWCAPLARHLVAGGGRRWGTAQDLARRFDAYAQERPAMLLDWAAGGWGDGAGGAVPQDLRWQVELWRAVRSRLPIPDPPTRATTVAERLRAEPGVVDLPPRVSLFGPTRLTTLQLVLLRSLADVRDVHLWLPHPSPALWDAQRRRVGDGVRRRTPGGDDRVRHPLLAGLGRDARELQLRLSTAAHPDDDRHHPPVAPRPGTLLGRLQDDLAADATPVRAPLDPADRSLVVHACHGPARQVEVLRDVLVGLLADDPTLEPRDVLVMCPDIEDYAPLVSATFGLVDAGGEPDPSAHPGTRLRVRLADRSLRQTNPLLGVLVTLLDLAGQRVTSAELLDLAGAAPVRRRFGLSDDDLERLQTWVADAGVRWGFDRAHRRAYALESVGQGTWRAGLDRILVGVTMEDDGDRWLGLALPLDDVDSGDVDLAGRFAEFVDRSQRVLDRLVDEQPLADWLAVLAEALDVLTAVRERDSWQQGEARRLLARVADEAGASAGTALALHDVRVLLDDRLQGRPTRAGFRTGTLTMCSMVPMRSVPHRVVCLLGLDDGRFPRHSGLDGDDLLAREPCVGERDPRSEDRQLLLDAVLAAQERLVVLHTGADPRTGEERPAAVPIGELLDVVDAMVGGPEGGSPGSGRERVVVRHPLQPFDARCFTPGELGRAGPASFDEHALRGAQRAGRPREAPGPFLAVPLPDRTAGNAVLADEVALGDLVAFFDAPVKGFLKQRLELTLPREADELADQLDVELDALQRWHVGQRLLEARLRGLDVDRAIQAEWRRGAVPPGALGSRLLGEVRDEVEPLVAQASRERRGPADCLDVDVTLDDGTRLTGTVEPVHGTTLLRVGYSKLGPKARLRSWIELLALAAARPGDDVLAVTIGRPPGRGRSGRSCLGPVAAPLARLLLTDLVALRRRGLRAPLPLCAKASADYARERSEGRGIDTALVRARQRWASSGFGEQRIDGEDRDPAHVVVFGPDAPLDALLAAPGEPDDAGVAGARAAAEPARFGVLARRLWEPLLAAETW